MLVDQAPIGRTPRSNPVTYLKAFDPIRELFAATKDARSRGLTASHFSFNVPGGRCEACQGEGEVRVEMQFLADVFVPCDQCDGKRFKPQVLEVRYRGRSIHQVLDLTVREALTFFSSSPKVLRRLQVLDEIGLGYLRLGQPATTLSGGEAQRIKIAAHLSSHGGERLLYILDEPTTGLHFDDIAKLLTAFRKLLEAGHTLLVIEHNLDVIKTADYIIDLGPEGGEDGGRVVATGTPEQVAQIEASHTGRYLRPVLAEGRSHAYAAGQVAGRGGRAGRAGRAGWAGRAGVAGRAGWAGTGRGRRDGAGLAARADAGPAGVRVVVVCSPRATAASLALPASACPARRLPACSRPSCPARPSSPGLVPTQASADLTSADARAPAARRAAAEAGYVPGSRGAACAADHRRRRRHPARGDRRRAEHFSRRQSSEKARRADRRERAARSRRGGVLRRRPSRSARASCRARC